MRRVALLVPDAGPLISLALADALAILLKLEVPIYVVDAVLEEVTRDLSLPGAAATRRFVEDHPTRVLVPSTFVGETAAARRRAEPGIRLRGVGEAAIAEFLARLDEFVDPGTPVLVLFEDNDLRRVNVVARGDVHLLSTRALLVGMERAGLIPSADEIWERIGRAGRTPSDTLVDQPSPGTRPGSGWLPRTGTQRSS